MMQVKKVCNLICYQLGKSINCFYVIYLHVDLKGFLQFITGSTHATGSIAVVFDSDGSEAIVAGTCGKQLTLSTKILDKGLFVSAITTLGKEMSYTML